MIVFRLTAHICTSRRVGCTQRTDVPKHGGLTHKHSSIQSGLQENRFVQTHGGTQE